MSRKFSKRLTEAELEQIIVKALAKLTGETLPEGVTLHNLINPYDCQEKYPDLLDLDYDHSLKDLTPTVAKDLAKVEFDTENSSSEDAYGKGDTIKSLLGFHTLSNGLTFYGINAGGDWEWPIFYIVYFDGEKLRGYIPEDGNPWNTDTKTAYGNDEDSDEVNMKKRGWDDPEKNHFDVDQITNDILNRITEKK